MTRKKSSKNKFPFHGAPNETILVPKKSTIISKKSKPLAYSKKSLVVNAGQGLFASVDIANGETIVEFKGKFHKENSSDVKDMRSLIYFTDGSFLECPKDDPASFANDAINFTGVRRKILESLVSTKPFYRKHAGLNINATIKLDNAFHRAYIVAKTDIKANEEIFCHYGFTYWFQLELAVVGFYKEPAVNEIGFPKRLFEYAAFESYVREFYPDYDRMEWRPMGIHYEVTLHMKTGGRYSIIMRDYSGYIEDAVPDTNDNVVIDNKMIESSLLK